MTRVPQKTKQARALIELAAKDVLERNQRRGIQKTLRAMVVGVPNVGKSTFINRLYGGSIARTGDRPGVTKSNQWVKVSPYLEVLDTPGMLWPKLNDQRAATRLAYIGTIKDAVYDQYELCACLLADLMAVMPEQTIERYKIKNPSAQGYALLDEVCRGRGFLMRGGVCDLDRACAVILDEFREGKVGKLTLEDPPQTREEAHDGENPLKSVWRTFAIWSPLTVHCRASARRWPVWTRPDVARWWQCGGRLCHPARTAVV